MAELKYDIPEGKDPVRCRGCQALVWWVKTKRDKNMLVEKDGVPHWGRCPKSDRFKGYDPSTDPLRPTQRQQFDELRQREYRMHDKERGFMLSLAAKFKNGQRLTKGEAAYLHSLWEVRR